MIEAHEPTFDHYAFTDVPRAAWRPIVAEFVALASALDAATSVDDVRERVRFVFISSEDRFAADLVPNARALASLVRELVPWIEDQLTRHDTIAILGI